uniref:KIB1-4 beta-propeller domain-containing protein n=1 Tax=Leersia perrieri TaxID=77586 RepID=A0A0D9XWZ4_9ORYZ
MAARSQHHVHGVQRVESWRFAVLSDSDDDEIGVVFEFKILANNFLEKSGLTASNKICLLDYFHGSPSSHRRRLGWLVTAGDRASQPSHISLPSITTIQHVSPLYHDAGNLNKYETFYYDGRMRHGYVGHTHGHGGVLLPGSKPSSLPTHREVILRSCSSIIRGISYPSRDPVTTTASSGDIKWCLIAYYNFYIVNTLEGDLLQLVRIADYNELRTTSFEGYKIDYEKQCIEPIADLGECAIFVGTNYTTCLSIKDYPQLLPNHIYFDDDNEYWLYRKHLRRDVGVYDFENDCVSDVVPPQPWLNWPPPIWITPGFTKVAK